MRRRGLREPVGSGEDSFLDIVANLVGILLILITVIGVRAQEAWVESEESTAQETPADPPSNVTVARSTLSNLTSNVHEIQRQAKRLQQLSDRRRVERQKLQVLLTSAQQELGVRRSHLDSERRQQMELDREMQDLSVELAEMADQQRALEQARKQPIVLEHVPTPLAETVFGEEQHYRLKQGRLTYVPLNDTDRQASARGAAQARNDYGTYPK